MTIFGFSMSFLLWISFNSIAFADTSPKKNIHNYTDSFNCQHIQSVIKIGGNILNRKQPPGHFLKTVCDGWNCVFQNSLRPGLWSTLVKIKWKWIGKKATTKTITTQEIWHWHWIVSKKRTKHLYFQRTSIHSKCWKYCLWCVIHACVLRALMHGSLKKLHDLPEFGHYD
jgi:hypothetical protein